MLPTCGPPALRAAAARIRDHGSGGVGHARAKGTEGDATEGGADHPGQAARIDPYGNVLVDLSPVA